MSKLTIPQQEKEVPINQLHFWLDNPRLVDYQGDENDESIIDFLFKNKELQPLCESITQNTELKPQERLVIHKENGKNVVYDGNRRLACYKILSNPSLIKKYEIDHLIADTDQAKKISPDYEVSCLVCSKKGDAVKYVQNQHTNNAKLPWTIYEQQAFKLSFENPSKKDRMLGALFEYMKQPQSGIPHGFGKDMNHQSFNNFKTIMLHPMTVSFFNFHIDKDNKLEYANDFERKFPCIVYDIEKISHDNTNIKMSDKEMQSYLKDFLTVNEGDIAKQYLEDRISYQGLPIFANKNSTPKKRKPISKSNPISTKRKYVIPNHFRKTIPQGRFNNIYKELKTLEVDIYPNAAAMLFRTFFEFALNEFARKNNFEFEQFTPMKKRIRGVLDFLKKQNIDRRILQIGEKTYQGANDFFAITDFNAFVHYEKSYPDPTTLKNAWDELECFLDEII